MAQDRLVLPLVKYECDCIGFAPDAAGRIVMVYDGSEGDMGLWDATQGHRGKSFEPLSEDRAYYFSSRLQHLLYEGIRMETVRDAILAGVPRGTD